MIPGQVDYGEGVSSHERFQERSPLVGLLGGGGGGDGPNSGTTRLEAWADLTEKRLGRIEDKLDTILSQLGRLPTRAEMIGYSIGGIAVGFAVIGIIVGGLGWLETRATRISPPSAPSAVYVLPAPAAPRFQGV